MPDYSYRLIFHLAAFAKYVFIALTAASVAASVFIGLRYELLEALSSPSEKETEEDSSALLEDESDLPLTLDLYDSLYAQIKAADAEDFSENETVAASNLVSVDLSAEPMTLINQTSYTPDLTKLLVSGESETASYSLASSSELPLVLILHTHGTEAYAPEDLIFDEDYTFRSDDITQNVVAVGEVLAQTLEENGINTIHCEIMHDLESYTESYTKSAETAAAYLEKYPSIKYVLDVHRDAIYDSDGNILRPVTQYNGSSAAQVMLVVGTDERGADHSGWLENLTNAAKLQYSLFLRCPLVVRSINLRSASFNQQCRPGALLLEIGSNGNTLSEAKTAARLCGEALAAVIKGEVVFPSCILK